jgi:predicted nucleic-acid-binding protein
MRGLDTNVLLRYLTADEPRQCAAAERVVEECRRNEEPLYLSAVVLCELVWVLSSLYRQTKPQIAGCIEQILSTAQFSIEHDSLVRVALRSWRSGKGDFSDHLIGEICRLAGCRDTVTFDRELRHVSGFSVIA